MEADEVRLRLCAVLKEIQSSSALDCPTLNGKTRPIEDVPEFDSKIWPVATAMLAKTLGVVIADDVNIFREEHTRRALTMDETVAIILKEATPVPTAAEPVGVSK